MSAGGDGGATRRVRLRDVAELASVDVSVVSRALNDRPGLSIRPETRRRILEAAEQLDYHPNSRARSRRSGASMALGLILPDLHNVSYAAIAEGAEERALESGYALVVAPGRIAERFRMLAGRVDGLLIANATSDRVILGDAAAQTPTVLVNRRETGAIPSVTVDDQAGASLVTKYLAELGHRRIGHVAGPQNTDTARRRREGFLAAMRAQALPVKEHWIAEGAYTEAGGYAATVRILQREPRPTALFATSLTATIGAMAAVRRLGLRIPADISVVGYDDVPLATYLDPPLTTVRMPLGEMGRQAVDALLALIAGQSVSDTIIDIPPELVVRGSTAPPREA